MVLILMCQVTADNDRASFQKGLAMPSTDRRKPSNARLRAKVDHIQAVSQQLTDSIAHVQAQTLAWVRQAHVTDLPSAELGKDLQAVFQAQRAALADIQHETLGSPSPQPPRVLITEAELAALMKP